MSVLSLRLKDSELESRDSDGHTPLIRAAWQGDAAAVQRLLDKGAKTETTDAKQGRTPVSFAALGGYVVIVRLLLDNGAKIDAEDSNSQTPLSWAAWGGDEATLRLLINRGAKIESKDKKQGRTPLSFAALAGSETAVRVLIDHGAEIEARDKNGRTPAWWADWGGYMAVVRLLTRPPSSAAAINSQQVSHRLGLGKENTPRVLASSAHQRRDEFEFVRESSAGNRAKLVSLCEACRSVKLSVSDFTAVNINANKQGISGANIIKSASLAAIKAAQNCSLCRLVALALEDSRSEWSALDGRDLDDLSLEVHVRLVPFPWLVSRPFNVLDIWTAQPFHSTSFGLQLFPSEAQGLFIGRSLGPQVSIPIVKCWVAKCMEFHGQDCGQSKSHRFQEIESMMLAVDVTKERIAAITANDEYLALSYVWGKVKSFSLRKENFKKLQQPGGLSATFKLLPQTIRDAITVTRQLGYRYLWIDSLCIVQDDAEFKSKIINKMDLVYENAFMTLIAASGSDANSGLPGIGSSSRTSEQQFADVSQDLRLIYARTQTAILETTWASRAWTYQEYFFSKRRLIFHDGKVFFHCRKRSWREDLALERYEKPPQQFDLYPRPAPLATTWEPVRGRLSRPEDVYWEAVRAYSRRALSWDSDALNAFSGVINHFESEEKLGTEWGLLDVYFATNLFWQSELFMARRDGFPTWSWLGWSRGRLAIQKDLCDYQIQCLSQWLTYWRFQRSGTRLLFYRVSPALQSEPSKLDPEEEAKTAILLFTILARLWKNPEEGTKSPAVFHNRQEVANILYRLAALATPKSTLPLAYHQDQVPLAQGIHFRTLTANVWISACAPNGEVPEWYVGMPGTDIVLRPCLYLYSSKEPTLEPLGVAYLQDAMQFQSVSFKTSQRTPSKVQTYMNPGSRKLLFYTAQPGDVFPEMVHGTPETEGNHSSRTRRVDATHLSETDIEAMSFTTAMPDETVFILPDDAEERKELLHARRIQRARIAIISGPVKGEPRSLYGVPFGYWWASDRGFFRVLILHDTIIMDSQGKAIACSQRLGVGELELNAIARLGTTKFEEIFLV